MNDLISRAAATRAAVISVRDYLGNIDSERDICIEEGLYEVPAVDAVPVVHARWITYPECLGYDGAYHDEHIVCSACHSVWNIIDNDTERFDHCPACGAKMDKEDA